MGVESLEAVTAAEDESGAEASKAVLLVPSSEGNCNGNGIAGAVQEDESCCGDNDDEEIDDTNANLNFFLCLLVCFKFSRFAWVRRRRTKGSVAVWLDI